VSDTIPFFDYEAVHERTPVWIALSDLYLDTDSRLSYAYIARTLAASKYKIEELHAILLEEVAPVVEFNLLQVAGEWAGFDEKWLLREILDRQGRRRSSRLCVDITSDWRCIKGLTQILRGLPPGEALLRSRAWHALILLFLDKKYSPRTIVPPGEYALPHLERFFRHELWPLLIEGSRRLAKQSPKNNPNEADIEANWKVFVDALPVQNGADVLGETL
jgi:hypothetical protein